jgi:Lon protease-like protein
LTHLEIPLFPLGTVLFPVSYLPLRIFEQRYLALVRDCARNDTGFGVCLIKEGSEAGDPATPHAIGTLASISDWYTMDDGLLGVTICGGQRFNTIDTRVDGQGLLHGRIEWLPDSPFQQLPVDYSLLAQMLERMMERMTPGFPDYTVESLEDAAWVGFRLADLLPLDPLVRQDLLELNDPEDRLQRLLELIPSFLDG